MFSIISSGPNSKLILRGIHLHLTDAMRAAISAKAKRLFRHERGILRLRLAVEPAYRGRARVFAAKGMIEIAGPDLRASITTGNAYNSVALLIDKLDRLLRKRTTALRRHRTTDDIRAHAGAFSPV